MNLIQKNSPTLFAAMVAGAALGAVWLRAQDSTASADAAKDKWTQIADTNAAMQKQFDTLDENLQFIRIRITSSRRP